jgi:hypothetical protein
MIMIWVIGNTGPGAPYSLLEIYAIDRVAD